MKTLIHSYSSNLLFLDGLRGLAALYVLIGHARWLLWEGYQFGYRHHPDMYSPFNKVLMYALAPFKYGHQMVLFFFVLSGFVIHMKYAGSLQKTGSTHFNYNEFLIKRIRRIYPPFVFALLLCLVMDSLGKSLGFPIYFGQSAYPMINQTLSVSSSTPSAALGNLFFLFTEYVPLFGTNNPTWSLKFEWWFYMLYPLFLLGMRKSHVWATGSMIGLYILSLLTPWPIELLQHVFSYMLCWWLGVVLCEIYTGRLRMSYIVFTAISWVSGSLIAIFAFPNTEDLAGSLVWVGVLSLLLHLIQKGFSLTWLNRLKPLGDFSYTLYITHFPLLVFFSGWLMKQNHGKLPMHFGYVAMGIVVCIALAYVFAFFTERPFMKKAIKAQKNVLQTQFAG